MESDLLLGQINNDPFIIDIWLGDSDGLLIIRIKNFLIHFHIVDVIAVVSVGSSAHFDDPIEPSRQARRDPIKAIGHAYPRFDSQTGSGVACPSGNPILHPCDESGNFIHGSTHKTSQGVNCVVRHKSKSHSWRPSSWQHCIRWTIPWLRSFRQWPMLWLSPWHECREGEPPRSECRIRRPKMRSTHHFHLERVPIEHPQPLVDDWHPLQGRSFQRKSSCRLIACFNSFQAKFLLLIIFLTLFKINNLSLFLPFFGPLFNAKIKSKVRQRKKKQLSFYANDARIVQSKLFPFSSSN